MSAAPNQLSFLPEDYLELKTQRRTNAICASLFALVAVGVGAAFYLTERMVNKVEGEYTQVLQRYTEAARPIEEFHLMQDKQRQMESQAALSASLLEKVPRSYLLAEITNALPQNVSLLEFGLEAKLRQNTAAPTKAPVTMYEQKLAEIEKEKAALHPVAKPREYDVFLHLTGMADNDQHVAAFMKALSSSKLLTDVNLVVSDEYQPSPTDEKIRKFQIEMQLSPDAKVEGEPQKKLNKLVTAN
jgi:Tfp pilus assembly protein PilN